MGGQTRIGELRRRVVLVIEEIVDLERDLEALRQVVMDPEVGNRIPG